MRINVIPFVFKTRREFCFLAMRAATITISDAVYIPSTTLTFSSIQFRDNSRQTKRDIHQNKKFGAWKFMIRLASVIYVNSKLMHTRIVYYSPRVNSTGARGVL